MEQTTKDKIIAWGREWQPVWKIAAIVNMPPDQLRYWLTHHCPDPAVRRTYRENPDL